MKARKNTPIVLAVCFAFLVVLGALASQAQARRGGRTVTRTYIDGRQVVPPGEVPSRSPYIP